MAEDIPFLVQQLLGRPISLAAPQPSSRDSTAEIELCRLLAELAAQRNVRLQPPAANLVLGALRRWADAPHDGGGSTSAAAAAPAAASAAAQICSLGTSAAQACDAPLVPAALVGAASRSTPASLQLEAVTTLSILLPEHLGALSEHERAAQLAALQSLLAAPPPRDSGGVWGCAANALELQTLALTALAACSGRSGFAATAAGGSGSGSGAEASSGGGLTTDEAYAVLSAVASLLQACVSRSRPIEDAAHSRLYAALLRALQAAIGEARQAWVTRAASLVEGLQRFLTYGVQASVHPTAGPKAPGQGLSAVVDRRDAGASPSPAGGSGDGGGTGGGGGGRYRPPHLRHRDRQADVAGTCSDSDMSDTEHAGTGGGGAAVDRFRSSRVRLGALSCVQAMAKSDPRAMHAHWTALLPLQASLQPKPLTPHLLTVLLHDPLIKVRALAASTVAVLLDGPAQRSILAVAEAKSMGGRAPVRGFLTLSLSLGQLLLAAHAGLLAAVGSEASGLVLTGVLRALVALIAASPYERLPQELLPETVKALRARWAALCAAPTAAAAGELAPIQAAYLACLAECFSTKQPIAGLAAYLQSEAPSAAPAAASCAAAFGASGASSSGNAGGAASGAVTCSSPRASCGERSAGSAGSFGCAGIVVSDRGERQGGGGAGPLVDQLLALASDPSAAAVVRIEALAALKGIAAHYAFAMSAGAWSALCAASAVGLASHPHQPRSPSYSRSPSGPPSRSSSSSSLNVGPARGASAANAGRSGPSWRNAPPASQSTGPASISPDDKAAQLAVKLLSEYLAAVARQYGLSRTDMGGAGAGDADGAASGGPGPLPSPGVVSLAAAVPRHQQHPQQASIASPASAASEEEVAAGLQRLAGMWRDAVALLVPGATCHSSDMVRSAGLACLGEVPAPVFALLEPQLQQRLLALLSAAAASDAVAAARAAACRALGAAAAFPPVLAHAELSDQVSAALAGCLRDSVMSVRIAAGWAVANLCDAHRRRLEEASQEAPQPQAGRVGWANGAAAQDDSAREDDGRHLLAQRAASHRQASTSSPAPGSAAAAHRGPSAAAEAAAGAEGDGRPPPLEPHHYRQLAALCEAAITASQDADKVRANGIRAVGNLLAALSPDMAPGLATGGAAATGAAGTALSHATPAAAAAPGAPGDGLRPQGWAGRRGAAGPGSPRQQTGAMAAPQSHASAAGIAAAVGSSSGGGGGVRLDAWLDSALTCLQSTLTTGGMKVQWNACYALLGLLRNQRLLGHPRLAGRTAPLLLLLVMLVRDSANFKIRTHAAAALAALPSREAYADVLPDALLVVASALEGMGTGGGGSGAMGPSAAQGGGGKGGGSGAAAAETDGGDGGDGRIPNYRYAAGLSAQLRATLLHLLALAQPADARRVREALARRADFLHTCLREQLYEAVLPLRTLLMTPGIGASGSGGGKGPHSEGHPPSSSCGGLPRRAGSFGFGAAELELPADPFGLSGSATGHGASSRDGPGCSTLAALMEGVSLRAGSLARSGSGRRGELHANVGGSSGMLEGSRGLDGAERAAVRCRNAEGTRPGAALHVHDGDAGKELRSAQERVAALAAPLRGFAGLLPQLGPAFDHALRDAQEALARMPAVVASEELM